MLNIKLLPATEAVRSATYTEVHQDNCLRWTIVKYIKEQDGIQVYQEVSKKMKCRDYFNDVVVAFNTGDKCSMYGFVAEEDTFNRDWLGLPVLLHKTYAGFMHNIEHIINPYLDGMEMPTLHPEKLEGCDEVLLNIPVEYLKSVFFMSTITLLIRVANQPKKSSWDDLIDSLGYQDKNLMESVKNKPMNKLPEKYKDKIIAYGMGSSYDFSLETWPTYMSGNSYQRNSYVHSCGVRAFGGVENSWA